MASLLPSNRVPSRPNGGGAPPLGKRPLTEIPLGRCSAAGAVSCCADALLAATASTATKAKGTSRVAAARRSGFRQGEDIERPSGCGFRLEIRHESVHAKRAGGIPRIKVAGDDGASPAADPRQDGDIFMSVRTTIGDRLADDPGASPELPFRFAGLGVDGFEPAVHGSVENQPAGGGHRAAPQRQVLLDGPDRLALYRIPGGELAAIAAGAGLRDDLGTDERRASDVADGPALPIHAQVLMRQVHQASRRRKCRRIPVLEPGRGRADVVYDSADLGELVRVHDGPPGLEIDAENGIDVAVWLGRDDLAALTVHHVEMTVAVRMQQHLARVAAYSHVDQDMLVDPVVVVLVMRIILQRPFGGAGIGITRE